MLLFLLLVAVVGVTIYIGYLSQAQFDSMHKLFALLKDAGVIDKMLNTTQESINKQPVGLHFLYGIGAFFAFIMFILTGLIKFHLNAIAQAQAMHYGFMRVDHASSEKLSEVNNALTNGAFPLNTANEIEVHAGIEAINKSIASISKNITEALSKIKN